MHQKVGRRAVLLIVAGMVACHQDHGNSAAAPTAMKPVAPAAIQEVLIGVGVQGTKHTSPTPLTTRDPISLLLTTKGSPEQVQLSARLFCLVTGTEAGKITMNLDRKAFAKPVPLSFPSQSDRVPGRYTIEIKFDGKLVAKRYFDIAPAPSSNAASSSH